MIEKVYQINLAAAGASVRSALRQLEYMIASIRAVGGAVVKFYHGGEDSGELRTAVRRRIRRFKNNGEIAFFIPGEQFGPSDATSAYLVEKYPFVARDPEYGRGEDDYVVVCIPQQVP